MNGQNVSRESVLSVSIWVVTLINWVNLEIIKNTAHLYSEGWTDNILSIQTHYEKLHIDDGDTIHYISFYLDKNKQLLEPDFQKDDEWLFW